MDIGQRLGRRLRDGHRRDGTTEGSDGGARVQTGRFGTAALVYEDDEVTIVQRAGEARVVCDDA